jgi:hypothetical protein
VGVERIWSCLLAISISLMMSQSGASEREGAGYKTVSESLIRAIKA